MMLAMLLALLVADPNPQQLELLKTFRAEFVEITPGQGRFPRNFRLGPDLKAGPSLPVELGYSFQVARYEVPQNLWEAVMGSNPSKWKGPRNSVEMLTFAEAEAFCRRATELMRAAKLIQPDERIRLPSEAEWEYVCRAGTETTYSFGDDVQMLGEFAWFTGNAAGNDPPVGAKKPNPWGLYDIHGYLSEWCTDTWHDSLDGAPKNGRAWTDGGDAQRRVIRGGSWKDAAPLLASGHRRAIPQETRDDAVGLRCILAKAP